MQSDKAINFGSGGVAEKILGEDCGLACPFDLLARCAIGIALRQIHGTAKVVTLEGKNSILEVGISNIGMRMMNDKDVPDFSHSGLVSSLYFCQDKLFIRLSWRALVLAANIVARLER